MQFNYETKDEASNDNHCVKLHIYRHSFHVILTNPVVKTNPFIKTFPVVKTFPLRYEIRRKHVLFERFEPTFFHHFIVFPLLLFSLSRVISSTQLILQVNYPTSKQQGNKNLKMETRSEEEIKVSA